MALGSQRKPIPLVFVDQRLSVVISTRAAPILWIGKRAKKKKHPCFLY